MATYRPSAPVGRVGVDLEAHPVTAAGGGVGDDRAQQPGRDAAAAGRLEDAEVGDVGPVGPLVALRHGADQRADRLRGLRVVEQLGEPPVVPAVAGVLAQAVDELVEGLLRRVEVVGEGALEHVVDRPQAGLVGHPVVLAPDEAEAHALALPRLRVGDQRRLVGGHRAAHLPPRADLGEAGALEEAVLALVVGEGAGVDLLDVEAAALAHRAGLGLAPTRTARRSTPARCRRRGRGRRRGRRASAPRPGRGRCPRRGSCRRRRGPRRSRGWRGRARRPRPVRRPRTRPPSRGRRSRGRAAARSGGPTVAGSSPSTGPGSQPSGSGWSSGMTLAGSLSNRLSSGITSVDCAATRGPGPAIGLRRTRRAWRTRRPSRRRARSAARRARPRARRPARWPRRRAPRRSRAGGRTRTTSRSATSARRASALSLRVWSAAWRWALLRATSRPSMTSSRSAILRRMSAAKAAFSAVRSAVSAAYSAACSARSRAASRRACMTSVWVIRVAAAPSTSAATATSEVSQPMPATRAQPTSRVATASRATATVSRVLRWRRRAALRAEDAVGAAPVGAGAAGADACDCWGWREGIPAG